MPAKLLVKYLGGGEWYSFLDRRKISDNLNISDKYRLWGWGALGPLSPRPRRHREHVQLRDDGLI